MQHYLEEQTWFLPVHASWDHLFLQALEPSVSALVLASHTRELPGPISR